MDWFENNEDLIDQILIVVFIVGIIVYYKW
jgi:hypothetical protein